MALGVGSMGAYLISIDRAMGIESLEHLVNTCAGVHERAMPRAQLSWTECMLGRFGASTLAAE
jgi:hypothetical protein